MNTDINPENGFKGFNPEIQLTQCYEEVSEILLTSVGEGTHYEPTQKFG